MKNSHWWQSAVIYQIYPRSFSDSNGDGIGDIQGIIGKLGYLELLEIDAIWLSPITQSPMADHGYDVSDPRNIDPLFGTIADFEELLDQAHARDIKVIMDLVPNHTSEEHIWFQEALQSPPNSAARQRYYFRDGLGEHGENPPNNWPSVFGGSAWTRIMDSDGKPEQWYLHLFAPEQPDLNWENPDVMEDLEKTLKFWLDKGIDGFRIDVAHGMAKPTGLPDIEIEDMRLLHQADNDNRFNQPAVHEIHKKIRSIIDQYPETMTVGEIWVRDNESFSHYIRADELHLGFNFRLTEAKFEIKEIRSAIENSLAAVIAVDGTPTWALSNHDVPREVSRYALSDDEFAGLNRARAMLLVVMALPGSIFVYQGAELGLPDAFIPEKARQDPVWERSGHTEIGRDGARAPLPWENDKPPFGFSSIEQTWLPIPEVWSSITVEKQLEDPYSTFSLYRATIEIRKNYPMGGGLQLQWFEAPENCLAFRAQDSTIICALNGSAEPIALPPGQVVLASAPLTNGVLAPYSAVWVKVEP